MDKTSPDERLDIVISLLKNLPGHNTSTAAALDLAIVLQDTRQKLANTRVSHVALSGLHKGLEWRVVKLERDPDAIALGVSEQKPDQQPEDASNIALEFALAECRSSLEARTKQMEYMGKRLRESSARNVLDAEQIKANAETISRLVKQREATELALADARNQLADAYKAYLEVRTREQHELGALGLSDGAPFETIVARVNRIIAQRDHALESIFQSRTKPPI